MKIAAATLGFIAITGCAATGAQHTPVASHSQHALKAPAVTMPARVTSAVRFTSLDDVDRMRIARQGSVEAAVRVCAAPDGRVSRAEVVESSGIKRVDSVLLAELLRWTYEPYKPTFTARVCETVHVVYRG